MAAQHLAAIKIQSAIRKFLYLKRKAERKSSIRPGAQNNSHR